MGQRHTLNSVPELRFLDMTDLRGELAGHLNTHPLASQLNTHPPDEAMVKTLSGIMSSNNAHILNLPIGDQTPINLCALR